MGAFIKEFPKFDSALRKIKTGLHRRRLGALGADTFIDIDTVIKVPEKIFIGSECFLAEKVILEARTEKDRGIVLGDRVVIRENTILTATRGTIVLDDNAWVGPNCLFYGNGGLVIGKKVLIAGHTVIATINHNFDRLDVPIYDQGTTFEPVTICDGAWVGLNTSIMPGVTIGEGAVVGAGSVVTKNIPPYCIAVGNPARVVKKREGKTERPSLRVMEE